MSRQFCQSQGCFFTCARPTLEYDAFFLLANNKRRCWILQVPKLGDGLVYANDMLQCLHPITNDVEEKPGPTIFHIIDPTSAHSCLFQLSATGCLAFLILRLFRAASFPIICCIYRYIFFSLVIIMGWKKYCCCPYFNGNKYTPFFKEI